MPGWQVFHGWMAFDRLSENKGLTRAFTIAYRLTDEPTDPWTARFNAFKKQERAALRSAAALMRDAVPVLVKALEFKAETTVFVPALRSGETVAQPVGVLWQLTNYAATCAGVGFTGDSITKKPHASLHSQPDVASRRTVLAVAEFKSKQIQADTVMIFDDLITSGATMSHIAGAILKRNPKARVFAVALGKAERREYQKSMHGVEISNAHVPHQWERSWRNAT